MRIPSLLLCDDDEDARSNLPAWIMKNWNAEVFGRQIHVEACEDIVPDADATQRRFGVSQVAKYDALLLDVWWGTPGVGGVPHGVDIAKAVREQYPEKPIILLSENVQLEDFQRLLPLGISAYITKNDTTNMAAWCVQIDAALTRAYEDRAGRPLYQQLRSLLANKPDPWCAKEVGDAASEVWRHDSPFQKWDVFWKPWTERIGKMRLPLPFEEMQKFFADDELLTLAVLSSMRGHLEHVLYVYFTGYIISHAVPTFRSLVMKAAHELLAGDYREDRQDTYWDLFQFTWLATATLHDIAYPLEVLPDVARKCTDIEGMFPFAKHKGKLALPAPLRYEWDDESASTAQTAFKFILERLYTRKDPFGFIADNIAFPSQDGGNRFNHGVASGTKFLTSAEKWAKLTGVPPEFKRFLQWGATAMALHALKHSSAKGGLSITLELDPLGFLLAICDELQVWNRTRPDATKSTECFRRVDLAALQVDEKSIAATIEYIPFKGTDNGALDEAFNALSKKVNKDQNLLQQYLKPRPISVEIQSRIVGLNKKLTPITLQPE